MIFFSFNYSFISGVEGPQTSMYEQIDTIKSIVFSITPEAEFYYKGFFITDFIWPVCMLLVIGLYFMAHIKNSNGKINTKLFNLWFIIAILAYGLDVCENLQYLGSNCCLSTIVPLKISAYALVIILPLIVAYIYSETGFFRDIVRFLRSAYISLIIIALIALLMAFIPQGVTIMIHLLESPFNFLVAIFLINFLSILVSHYPVYVGFAINENFTEKYDLGMSKDQFLGLGIIIYFTKKFRSKVIGINTIFKKLNRYLGVILLCIWSCALIIAAESYINFGIELLSIFFLLFFLSIFYYNHRSTIKDTISEVRDAYTGQENELKFIIEQMNAFCSRYKFLLVFFAALLVACLFCVSQHGWSKQTLLSCIFLSIVNVALYIEFRLSRSFFKYLSYNETNRFVFAEPDKDCLISRDVPVPKPIDIDFFVEGGAQTNAKNTWLFAWLPRFSDNQFYIKSFRVAGTVTFIYLLSANIFISSVEQWGSSINIILSFLIIAYSAIVILLKHWIFYRYEFKDPSLPLNELEILKKYRIYYAKYLPISLVLFFAILSVSRSYLNKIHELDMIPQGDELCLEDYIQDFKQKDFDGNTVMSIASDGGGLKANLWNLLVLNENPELAKKSFVMSGVSGGSLGIGNYVNLISNKDDTHDILINEIGNANILAIDVAGLLMRDFVMSYTTQVNKDRSYYAMRRYAKTLNLSDQEFEQVAYRTRWLDQYKKMDGRLALLNINASSTTYKQGYALSVCHAEDDMPASIDMVGFKAKSKSISYYNAVSTSNRFPFASPAAKIVDKGYFVDGGYFENSGILAAENIFEMSKDYFIDSLNKEVKHEILNIRNGKTDWVKAFLTYHNFNLD